MAVPKPRTGILMFGLRRGAKLREEYSAAEKLTKAIRVLPDGLSLGNTMRVQQGRVRMLGATTSYYRGTSRGVRYVHRAVFEELGPWTESEFIRFGDFQGGYTLFTSPGSMDYLSLPAFRVDVEGTPIILALINPSETKFGSERLSMSANYEEDRAEADVRLRPGAIEGSIRRTGGRARHARLELIGELEVSVGGLEAAAEVCVELVKAVDGWTNFRYELPPREAVLLVTSTDVSPTHIVTKSLGLKRPAVSGMSEGRYRLSLVLDVPFKPDVRSEVELPTAGSG